MDVSRSFAIDAETGAIRVIGQLSSEELVNQYVLIVIARDDGSPPQSAETTVTVNVIRPGPPADDAPMAFQLDHYRCGTLHD